MDEPLWLSAKVVLALHDSQLAAHGGLAGVRDINLLESALAKPQMAWSYEAPAPDIYQLAALYTTGIARNHPFHDANKRSAWVTGQTFLYLNGHELVFEKGEALLLMLNVAQGETDTVALAAWMRTHVR
jgi:death on curing protein